jgi:hypothetical protein
VSSSPTRSATRLTRIQTNQCTARVQACVHDMYCTNLGVPPFTVIQLATQLVDPTKRLPGPLPKEGVRGSFPEATIQTLGSAVGLPRQVSTRRPAP